VLCPVLPTTDQVVLRATADRAALYLVLHTMSEQQLVFEVTRRTSCICFT